MRRQSTPSGSTGLRLSGPEMFPPCWHVSFCCGREVSRGKWGTGVPVIILGSVVSHLVLSVQVMSSSEMPHSGQSLGNIEKVLALLERRWRVWSISMLIFKMLAFLIVVKTINTFCDFFMFTVSASVLYLLFASNKIQNTSDFCLGVGHKYLEWLQLYLELLMTLLDGIKSREIFFQLW